MDVMNELIANLPQFADEDSIPLLEARQRLGEREFSSLGVTHFKTTENPRELWPSEYIGQQVRRSSFNERIHLDYEGPVVLFQQATVESVGQAEICFKSTDGVLRPLFAVAIGHEWTTGSAADAALSVRSARP